MLRVCAERVSDGLCNCSFALSFSYIVEATVHCSGTNSLVQVVTLTIDPVTRPFRSSVGSRTILIEVFAVFVRHSTKKKLCVSTSNQDKAASFHIFPLLFTCYRSILCLFVIRAADNILKHTINN